MFILSTPQKIINFCSELRYDAIKILQNTIPFCFINDTSNNKYIKHQISSSSNLLEYYNDNSHELCGNISPNDYFDDHYKVPEFKHTSNKIQRSMSDNIYSRTYTYNQCFHCNNTISSKTHIYAYNDNIYCTAYCRSNQIQHDKERHMVTRNHHSYSI